MLISEESRYLNAQAHKDDEEWGKGDLQYLKSCLEFIQDGDKVLDYGCGKGLLARELLSKYKIHCTAYDPAVPAFSRVPYAKYDKIICIDVLEHVEPELLGEVLDHMFRLLEDGGMVYFVIGTVRARKIMSDGSNAHRIINGRNWWTQKLAEHFSFVEFLQEHPKNIELLTWH